MIYFDNAATTKPSERALKQAAASNDEYFFKPTEFGSFLFDFVRRVFAAYNITDGYACEECGYGH